MRRTDHAVSVCGSISLWGWTGRRHRVPRRAPQGTEAGRARGGMRATAWRCPVLLGMSEQRRGRERDLPAGEKDSGQRGAAAVRLLPQ